MLNRRSIWPYGSSNYGDAVDIWAPGTVIKSAIVGGGFDLWNGTSMASMCMFVVCFCVHVIDFENTYHINTTAPLVME